MSETAKVLLQDWKTPFGLPPFSQIKPEDFEGAFEEAFKAGEDHINRIAQNSEEPTFENTIAALELAEEALEQVASVFFNLSSADTNETLQQVERSVSPKLAAYNTKKLLNPALFKRVETLMAKKDTLGLTPEQDRVLERYYSIFHRAGAGLDETGKSRIAEINERLATLGTSFAQNVLADEASYKLVLENESDLEGLPEFLVKAASAAAEERGEPGKYAITLSRSSIEPFLQFSKRRDLREEAFNAWAKRGDNAGETNNSAIVRETVQLRNEKAKLLGFESFAAFKLDDVMAKTTGAVDDLLTNVWGPAKARAQEEAADLQDMAQSEGDNIEIAPWDWRYYSEKVRSAKHDLDEAEIKPYFQLDQMIDAAFYTATRLFGLTFKELQGQDVYHPDVRVFEVFDKNGDHLGIFIGDYFARASKRSGAWMSAFRSQQKLKGDIRPIIVNVMNFSKAPEGEQTLLTFDDARTLFHEFGHGLHGLMSNVTHPLVSGTSVARDFVELPSQLFEHWLAQPEILKKFARHYQTGEVIPEELLERLLAAANFNQGFATVEYLATAIVDMAIHKEDELDNLDPAQMEKKILEGIGMPKEIIMRHRIPHLLHAFAGDGYSAGYYSYLWSEVMDADAFEAFEETGDAFDPDTAAKLEKFIYAAGGSQDPAKAYMDFRGKMPSIEPLLKGRGLVN
ncbi:Peptidyl-dipeptidase dcp (Dipeptidyl carboxypeptidase) [Pseudovibrio sp. FO-BEG1]|uniref:M3 family metallopeptidase n=1 Tax=Pseudovibrio sp. (strain FO-BEG1) TaxID=911045 RepID=UPI000238D04A|nr:M3 family metallopeptidase [Pseudovibrio sp. FO-BEG1]AEV38028.1 Peptidyl-dipeptidase dcp (Dipeptidyl carboxypeptidase) [Pseudovibrio sp. FO-BEG1]